MYTMLLDGLYPQDIRVRKEAESLAEEGIEVCVIARWKKGLSRNEVINGVEVIRVGINYSHFTKGIHDILFSLFFIDFVFYFGLKAIIKERRISLLHVHDLPLVKTARLLLPSTGKVILDMHENYPEMLEGSTNASKGLIKYIKDKIFFGLRRWKRYESKVIHIPHHIIAVVEEMKDKLIHEYQLNPSSITVVSNYEKLSFSSIVEVDDFKFSPDTFYVAYVGGISVERGLETVIEAISKLNHEKEKVVFLIIGDGNAKYVQALKQMAEKMDVGDKVLFFGYKEFNKICYYIENANINIIPHIKNKHTDHTIPHKLFQIWLQKSPLLVSSCKPLKRYIESHNAGFVFEASNADNLKEVILSIKSNPAEAAIKAENGYHIAATVYNWENESEKLINLIKSEYE